MAIAKINVGGTWTDIVYQTKTTKQESYTESCSSCTGECYSCTGNCNSCTWSCIATCLGACDAGCYTSSANNNELKTCGGSCDNACVGCSSYCGITCSGTGGGQCGACAWHCTTSDFSGQSDVNSQYIEGTYNHKSVYAYSSFDSGKCKYNFRNPFTGYLAAPNLDSRFRGVETKTKNVTVTTDVCNIKYFTGNTTSTQAKNLKYRQSNTWTPVIPES